MKKSFNLSRYKELLKLQENGKISFMDLELLSYQASVPRQISYTRKKDYFILIEGYLSGIITPSDFRAQFLQMDNEDDEKASRILKDFQKLEIFSLEQDLEEFSDLQGQIYNLCFGFNELWDGTKPRMSESEFYYLVNNRYSQLQKAFPFENFNNRVYKNLVSRSFNFLILTVGLEILLILINIRTIT